MVAVIITGAPLLTEKRGRRRKQRRGGEKQETFSSPAFDKEILNQPVVKNFSFPVDNGERGVR